LGYTITLPARISETKLHGAPALESLPQRTIRTGFELHELRERQKIQRDSGDNRPGRGFIIRAATGLLSGTF
jgi:hypothetical protein